MIDLITVSDYFESGLNAELNDPDIEFKIWANAGEKTKPEREGNKIHEYITGNLRVNSTANSANLRVMGVSGFVLDFSVPISRPRTNAKQTQAELQPIKDGQYPFVNYIIKIIDNFFQKSTAIELKDSESGKKYSVGISAGVAVPDNIDLVSKLGNNIPITVYIEFVYMEGGINAKDIVLKFNGSDMPFNVVKISRAGEIAHDVYAETLISKNLTTSTAFSIDVEFPANLDVSTQEAANYLISGSPNIAYFVTVAWGSVASGDYLMIFNTANGNAQGILIAGLGASLIECVENVELLNFPQTYSVGYFAFTSSSNTSLTFTTDTDCMAFIAGKAFFMPKGSQSINLIESDFEYSDETHYYSVYLVTDKAITITNASALFINDKTNLVSGVWRWNDNLPFEALSSVVVDFTSGGTGYTAIHFDYIGNLMQINYIGTTTQLACEITPTVTSWIASGLKTIDFGDFPKSLPDEFYNYLISNATRVS